MQLHNRIVHAAPYITRLRRFLPTRPGSTPAWCSRPSDQLAVLLAASSRAPHTGRSLPFASGYHLINPSLNLFDGDIPSEDVHIISSCPWLIGKSKKHAWNQIRKLWTPVVGPSGSRRYVASHYGAMALRTDLTLEYNRRRQRCKQK